MAGDCRNNNHNVVEAGIWKACGGSSVHIPGVDSRVYYFPEGHMDHSSDPHSVLPRISHLPPRPFFICRLLQVLYLVDPDSDEVYARIRLEPGHFLDRPVVEAAAAVVVSFAKVLTPSDANNGGGFSVPRFCADSIFPPLDYAADPPVQTLSITDLREQTWNFRHIYRGTPRRHLLTTGWSKFVNSKKLIGGDSVVFIKNKATGKLFVGVRRAKKSNNSYADLSKWASMYGAMPMTPTAKRKVQPESVVDALNLAANNMPFEVVYYPKAASTQDFVVAADKVEGAMRVNWRGGMRVKMPMETEDSSRLSWFEGTVSSVLVPDFLTWQGSPPWRMLQVAWDETEVLENMKRVSPWQVEFVPSTTPAIDAAFPQAKKPRLPQNCGFLTSVGEGDYPLPPPPPHMGFSNSMMGHLSSSYLNYNIFPAGMQGARQHTFHVSSSASVVDTTDAHQSFPIGLADNNLLEKTVAVSTDLSIGCSSQSDVVSPDSSSSILSSSPDVSGRISTTSADKVGSTSIQLFGQTIHMESPVHVGSGGGYVTNQESQVLLARIDVPCSKTVPTVDEACSLSLEK